MRLLISILLLFPLFTAAQSTLPEQKSDSLWQVWQDDSKPDTSRLKAIQKFTWNGYLFTQPDSAFYFANLQYNFAKAKKLDKQMAIALNTKGISYVLKGKYSQAIQHFTESVEIQKKIGDRKGVADVLNNIGNIYNEQGDYVKAIDYYIKSLQVKEKIGDKKGIATSHNNIGNIYNVQGDDDKALEEYTQSLKIREEIGDKKGISAASNNVGIIYARKGDYDKAIEHYTRSIKIGEEIGDKKGVSSSLNNLALIYVKQGDYKKAIEYNTESLKIKEEIGDKKGIATSLNNLGNIYQDLGNYKLAIDYSTNALQLAKEVESIIETRNAAESLWKANKKLGDFQESLKMHELYIKMRDSVQSKESEKEIIRQEYKYKYEKQATADSVAFAKQQEIKEVEIAKQQAEIKVRQNQQYALFGGLFLLVIFAAFMYNRFRVTRKQKSIIETQKEIVEESHREIKDSITYAKRLQDAILPSKTYINENLENSFVFFKPKDVVSGDFYFMDVIEEKNKKLVYYVAADCTGHGVPGAMVSIVGANGLKRCIQEFGLRDPGRILDRLAELVTENFAQSEERIRDGMDLALCCLEIEKGKTTKIHYAGANNQLWVINPNRKDIPVNGVSFKQGGGFEIKANKQAIGYTETITPFDTHTFVPVQGDTLYAFSDGFVDQFGGVKGKKYKSPNFKKLLLSIYDKDMDTQKQMINKEFESWKAELEQVDDVCVIGVRI